MAVNVKFIDNSAAEGFLNTASDKAVSFFSERGLYRQSRVCLVWMKKQIGVAIPQVNKLTSNDTTII